MTCLDALKLVGFPFVVLRAERPSVPYKLPKLRLSVEDGLDHIALGVSEGLDSYGRNRIGVSMWFEVGKEPVARTLGLRAFGLW